MINNLVYEELNIIKYKGNMLTTPDQLLKFMSNIKYDNETNDEKYIIKDPITIIKTKIGICYDQVELERYVFKKMKYDFKTFFAYQQKLKESSPTHTFLIFKENNQYYWFENAWESYRGIHGSFNSYNLAVNYVSNQLKSSSKWTDVNILEYSEPKLKNLNINQFSKYILLNN